MMRRSPLFVLVAALACGGGNTSGPSGPAPVASVNVSASLSTISVGQTTILSATALDASGNVLSGRTVTWSSSAQNVATVTSAGAVTGAAAGQTTITATVETKSAQTVITVIGAQANCGTGSPLALNVGDVHTLTASERSQLCLAGGTSGSEYVLIPFNDDTSHARQAVELAATGTIATSSPPATVAAAQRLGGYGTTLGGASRNLSFEMQLRQREVTELGPRMRTRPGPMILRSLQMAPGGRSSITGLPVTPAVGTIVTLNANGVDACTNRQNHVARVAAVTNTAIVLADTAAPAGGFTDADYQSIGTTFDTLVFPLDTSAYGAPFDMDHNGRVIMFFTQAVNQLTKSTDNSFIGGFFFARDLFPVAGNAQLGLQACAGSNEGEMFYLPVVDPTKVYNRFFTSKDTLKTNIIATVAHEFQHLINASRRLYVNNASDFEVVWLNEGMSHIAEELLYNRVAGFTPKSDLDYTAVVSSQARLAAINAYQVENLGRLSDYLAGTDVNSPYAPNDSLATRGATWELLRYALDQSSGSQNTYLHAIDNAQATGIQNFNAVFGATFGTITAAVRQQVLANFFDNTSILSDPKYSFPSWNYRSLLPHLPRNSSTYPLHTVALLSSKLTMSLVGGGSAYARFGVTSGTTAAITPTSGGGPVSASVELILVRTH